MTRQHFRFIGKNSNPFSDSGPLLLKTSSTLHFQHKSKESVILVFSQDHDQLTF